MPFTLAHPAAVLPFHGRRLPLLGLVAGSVAPDLHYFVPESLGRHIPNGHTPFGAVFVDPVLALVLLGVLGVLQRPLTAPLWGRHTALVNDLLRLPLTGLLGVGALLLSIYFGIALHLLWDSFTHSGGYPVRHLAWLSQPVLTLHARPIRLFSALQWVSSVVGVVILLVWYALRLRKTPMSASSSDAWQRIAAALLAVAAVAFGLVHAAAADPVHNSVHRLVYAASSVAVSAFFLGWCALGVLILARRHWHSARG